MRYALISDVGPDDGRYFDVVIVGSGIAGLYTALNIDPGLSCAIITKEGIETSNSWLAQGGIAAAMDKDDTPEIHLEDTLAAGAGMCDRDAVKLLSDEASKDINKLLSLRVPFDLTEDGDLQLGREGGHTRNRIVHAGGDATGRETVKTLAALVARLTNVTFLQRTLMTDILTDEQGRVCGALLADNIYKLIKTRSVVICTGGIGELYLKSTNPSVATGDGLAAAVRAGVRLRNMEFIQFHPTGLYSEGHEARSFLISEAVRGEGAILRNKYGERFMEGEHPMMDLAPRDIVARAIIREMKRTDAGYVELDATSRAAEFLSARFPTIWGECMKRGIDISKDMIPVCPVQHYLIGGIETDLRGGTCVPGLYACGEAAYTGVHGANRLASNSMLECLVFGRMAAEQVNGADKLPPAQMVFPEKTVNKRMKPDSDSLRGKIKQTMNEYGHVVRNERGLKTALIAIEDIIYELNNSELTEKNDVEVLNMATVSRSILEAALLRKESIGAHYRED